MSLQYTNDMPELCGIRLVAPELLRVRSYEVPNF